MKRPVALVFACLLASGCVAPGLKMFDWQLETSSSTGSSSGGPDTGVMTTTIDVDPGSGSGSGETTGETTGESTSTSTSTSGAIETSRGTSGEAPASCGDGIVDEGEECDDGGAEDDEACDASCRRERVVFVTSEKLQPDEIGGLEFADGICRQLAQAGDLPGFSTYAAWLSDSTVAAHERVFAGEGRYVRPDGVVVADSFAALLAGPLLAAIEIDEHGQPVAGAGAWTGTMPDGTAVPGATHCEDWTSATFADQSGYFGTPSATDSQ
ncbi:hypothetical protein [Nannocystis punicea]|uniref:Myxococcus cysteine-rich repeat-containing protein n=1 Tax=Nannocystis punicea TaxID=2995304 RepID=A0ABY7HAF3_9BACT|nr:hypothetical protein [Nannocystis poenicansa]WAS96254.1 hypothetical protein O0S08_08830 [Nannocystis poenicansa]